MALVWPQPEGKVLQEAPQAFGGRAAGGKPGGHLDTWKEYCGEVGPHEVASLGRIGLTARASCRPHLASGKCLLFSEPQHPARSGWVFSRGCGVGRSLLVDDFL